MLLMNVLNYLRICKSLVKLYFYDALRFLNNSMVLDNCKTQKRMLGLITARQHVVEKGLTMPNPKMGFGKDNLLSLVELCKVYEMKFDCSHEQFINTISVIKEYLQFHKKCQYELDSEVLTTINSLLDNYPDIKIHNQQITTSDLFFSSSYESFDKFATSRHSCRNYSSQDISEEEIKSVVKLAQTSPSACNRQPVRIHVCNKELSKTVLNYQNGSRGFGDLANKLIIVTTDLSSYLNNTERNCAYIDGGIFVMNLLYSLHYHKIGACTLNWSTDTGKDQEVRKLLNIPEPEEIICMITIGKLPDQLSIANSDRIKLEHILTIHN